MWLDTFICFCMCIMDVKRIKSRWRTTLKILRNPIPRLQMYSYTLVLLWTLSSYFQGNSTDTHIHTASWLFLPFFVHRSNNLFQPFMLRNNALYCQTQLASTKLLAATTACVPVMRLYLDFLTTAVVFSSPLIDTHMACARIQHTHTQNCVVH
jgi:hypothetical protein